jgi:predicted aconitase with swiveling domain
MKVKSSVLHGGAASGPILLLTEPVSFWGAFDPRDGRIVDVHHPQRGAVMAGHILLLPETRGSGGTPGGIAEAVRRQTGPIGIVLVKPDINLAIGAAVATRLYGRDCPVVAVTEQDYRQLASATSLTIHGDGTVEAV